jgi:hypothetical protein
VMAVSKDEFGRYGKCISCGQDHPLSKCPGFRSMTDQQKMALIRRNRACYRCMMGRHPRSDCPKTWTCRECNSDQHHTLLHGAFTSGLIPSTVGRPRGEQKPPPPPPPAAGTAAPQPQPAGMGSAQLQKLLTDLLAQMNLNNASQGGNQAKVAMPIADAIIRTISYLVAPAYVYHPLSPEIRHKINTVFDTCAEGCFMTERLATLLGLTGANQPQVLRLLSTSITVPSRLVQFGIKSTVGEHQGIMIANTVREIQSSIQPPDLKDLRKRFPFLQDIVFPDKAEGDQVDLLIGLEFFEWMAPYLVRYEGRGKPCVLHSLLGPVVMFGEPRKRCLGAHTAPVNNMAVTILAVSAEEEDQEPHPPPPAELLSVLWRYDLMGIDTHLKRPDKPYSINEQDAWDTLMNKIKFLANNALEIPVPWRPLEPCLMDNREEVRRDDLRQELRWEIKDNKVLEAADYDIQQQLKLKFIRMLSPQEYHSIEGRYLHWILVHRPDKMTTKVRIVFDASRRAACDGKSLNMAMHTGPSLLNEVFDVHNGNREKPVLITADISKMFPRFKLPPGDQKFHRFYWRKQVYEFSSVIFGTAAAPFMANFGILYLANKYAEKYPHILKAVKKGIYVDDLSISVETAEEARRYVDDFIEIYEKHDLPFRQWSCNVAEVIAHLPKEWIGKGMIVKPEESMMSQKTLGMTWHPKSDTLSFAVEPWDKRKITTLRRIVSYAPTLFDPQGLLLPLTLIAKVIISVICAARSVVNVDWDTPLEPLTARVDGLADVLTRWLQYTTSLKDLPNAVFPRAVRKGPAASIQLHLFTDASELAYGCCIYMRSISYDEQISVHLLCGKNRMAHLGQGRTIAEMELMGILCGAKMLERVVTTLDRVDKIYLWTDSRVCLHWISKPARQWKSFVAHRVTDIYALTKNFIWRHVPGKQNPADLATRGLSMTGFLEDQFWKHGPEFLMGPENKYPQWTPTINDDDRLPPAKCALLASIKSLLLPVHLGSKRGKKDNKNRVTDDERRHMDKFLHKVTEKERRHLDEFLITSETVVMVSKIGRTKGKKGKAIPVPKKYPKYKIKMSIATTPEGLSTPKDWDFTGMNPTTSTLHLWSNIGLATERIFVYERYSSFFRVARILAYMYRATKAPYNNLKHLWLRPEETHRALIRLITIEQVEHFGEELKYAVKHKRWPAQSKLASLAPIIGPKGELRVGGRLNLLKLPTVGRAQIIIPKSQLAVLLARDLHNFLGHSNGRDRLMTEVRMVYWVKGLRSIVEKVLDYCVTCQKKTRTPCQPLMAPLPAGAVPLGKILPFRRISADFAGPFVVIIGRSRHERYVLIYICQHTKGVHAEVTESLGTEHICNAFTRVFSRRGVPESIRTDNGPSLVSFKQQLWSDSRHHELHQKLLVVDWESLREFGGKCGVRDWEFAPPLGPNFNGLAEAAVRIWKKAFMRQFRKQSLRLDEFNTAVALAEDIINGRPLDYTDGKLYTPNHFITRGPPQEALPLIDPDSIHTIAMRYQVIEDVVQGMWDDFHPGWLYQMQRLPKWQTYRKNLEPGTLVLMFNDDKLKSTRNQWDVGRIQSVVTGTDGQVRKARVVVERPQNTLTQYDTVTHLRPVNKLVPIDLVKDQVARILPLDITKYPLREDLTDTDDNPVGNPSVTPDSTNALQDCEVNESTTHDE